MKIESVHACRFVRLWGMRDACAGTQVREYYLPGSYNYLGVVYVIRTVSEIVFPFKVQKRREFKTLAVFYFYLFLFAVAVFFECFLVLFG
jgi:hypothetical protein